MAAAVMSWNSMKLRHSAGMRDRRCLQPLRANMPAPSGCIRLSSVLRTASCSWVRIKSAGCVTNVAKAPAVRAQQKLVAPAGTASSAWASALGLAAAGPLAAPDDWVASASALWWCSSSSTLHVEEGSREEGGRTQSGAVDVPRRRARCVGQMLQKARNALQFCA